MALLKIIAFILRLILCGVDREKAIQEVADRHGVSVSEIRRFI